MHLKAYLLFSQDDLSEISFTHPLMATFVSRASTTDSDNAPGNTHNLTLNISILYAIFTSHEFFVKTKFIVK